MRWCMICASPPGIGWILMTQSFFEIAEPDFATAAAQRVQRLQQAIAAIGQPTKETTL